MKKILILISLALVLASVAGAEVFIGSRQAGMGGTGVANAVGLTAVAYNPAGLMDGPSKEFLLSLGAANQGLDKIISSAGTASPAQFMLDQYDNAIDANGSISGILGFNLNRIGISVVIPDLRSTLSKTASSLAGSYDLLGTGAAMLTLGRTFSTPTLPIASLDVGVNIKALYAAMGNITISGDPTVGSPVSALQTYWLGSGTGLDIGGKARVNVPSVSDFSIGIAVRNIAQTIKYAPKSRTDTYTVDPTSGDITLTTGTETEEAQTQANSPLYTVIGCAGTLPGIGLKFAADVESKSTGSGALAVAAETITHLGIEYPLLANALILRGGLASGQSTSMTTWGTKINIPFLTIEMANIMDAKNSKNNSYVVDIGIAF